MSNTSENIVFSAPLCRCTSAGNTTAPNVMILGGRVSRNARNKPLFTCVNFDRAFWYSCGVRIIKQVIDKGHFRNGYQCFSFKQLNDREPAPYEEYVNACLLLFLDRLCPYKHDLI